MITVKYHRDLNKLDVEGHAYSGEAGHDLVCASASILVYTLAYFVENMKEAGQVENPTLIIAEGHVLIDCNAPELLKSTITFAFDTICAGFELLARNYPENISYKIVE